jgi:5-methylcytosine-specific restriction endonuclease McrA
MSVVKCGACKKYLPKEEAVRNGVQSFHPGCTADAYKKSRPKKRKANTPDDLRSSVLLLDGHRCRFCGVRRDGSLHVHHVFYRSQQGPHEQSNLISLCDECHDTVHSDKKRYQRLCLGVIWLRSMGDKRITIPRLERELKNAST